METMTEDRSIKELELTTRAYNALIRARVHTIKDLLEFPQEKLENLNNLGKKSIQEINTVITDLRKNDSFLDKNDISRSLMYRSQNGELCYDSTIKSTNLTPRAINGLRKVNILLVSQLLAFSNEKLITIRNLGKKTCNEILSWKENYVPVPVTDNTLSLIGLDNKVKDVFQNIKTLLHTNQIKLFKEIGRIIQNSEMIENDLLIVNALYQSEFIKRNVSKWVLNCLEDKEVQINDLFKKLPYYLKDEDLFKKIVIKQIEEGTILYQDDGFLKREYKRITSIINEMEESRETLVYQFRLEGHTLQEIGVYFSITRERVRQLEKRIEKNLPRCFEDKFQYIFEKYNLEKDDFTFAFDEPTSTYNYLNNRFRKGKSSILEIKNDKQLSKSELNKLEKIVYKNFVSINGVRIEKKKATLQRHVAMLVARDSLSIDEFKEYYSLIIEEVGLEEDSILNHISRGDENRLASSNYILWGHGKKMRYYNIGSYGFKHFIKELNLSQYINIEISSQLIYRKHQDLMEEYDIRDCYELHNLLKKIACDDNYCKIEFKKMPNIAFGNADREKQILNLLKELAPISIEELANAYESEYGVNQNTARANLFKYIEQYYVDGLYNFSNELLEEESINILKKQLILDFYLIEEIKNVFCSSLDVKEVNLNSQIMKQVGYRLYSNYVIKENYENASSYFRYLLLGEDIFDINSFHPGIMQITSFSSELYKLKANYEIVEYSPRKYINIRKLKQEGIDKANLISYCDNVYNGTKLTFFTIKSIRNNGFEDELHSLGFDDYFYSSIIAEDKYHFSCRRVGENRLFRVGQTPVTVYELIETLVFSSSDLMYDIYDLFDDVIQTYGLNLQPSTIIECIKDTSLYYDRISEKVFADYDVYFEQL